MGRLKPIIKPFDSGWNYIVHISFKIISLLVTWSWKCNNVLKKKITSLQKSVIRVCQSTLNIFPQWISKAWIWKHKNHSKVSSVARRFAQNLRACKSYNTMYGIVNLEDTTNVTLSGVVTHNTTPFQLTFHIMVWWLKERRAVILKLLLLVDKIRCFMLLLFAKMLFFVDLQNWSPPFCLLTNLT